MLPKARDFFEELTFQVQNLVIVLSVQIGNLVWN